MSTGCLLGPFIFTCNVQKEFMLVQCSRYLLRSTWCSVSWFYLHTCCYCCTWWHPVAPSCEDFAGHYRVTVWVYHTSLLSFSFDLASVQSSHLLLILLGSQELMLSSLLMFRDAEEVGSGHQDSMLIRELDCQVPAWWPQLLHQLCFMHCDHQAIQSIGFLPVPHWWLHAPVKRQNTSVSNTAGVAVWS